jgi:hypothetical protein
LTPIILPEVVAGVVFVAAALTDALFLDAASATPAAEIATHAVIAAAATPTVFRVIRFPSMLIADSGGAAFSLQRLPRLARQSGPLVHM